MATSSKGNVLDLYQQFVIRHAYFKEKEYPDYERQIKRIHQMIDAPRTPDEEKPGFFRKWKYIIGANKVAFKSVFAKETEEEMKQRAKDYITRPEHKKMLIEAHEAMIQRMQMFNEQINVIVQKNSQEMDPRRRLDEEALKVLTNFLNVLDNAVKDCEEKIDRLVPDKFTKKELLRLNRLEAEIGDLANKIKK